MFPSARDKLLLLVDFFSAAYQSTNKILLPIIFVIAIPADYHFREKAVGLLAIDLSTTACKKLFQCISFQNYF